MELVKVQSEFGRDVFIKDDKKTISICFGGNLDLYISINSKEKDNNKFKFTITKEEYEIYEVFENLYKDIEDINIFDDDYNEDIEYEKMLYRKVNLSNYKELFNKTSKTITCYSDNTTHKDANILKIRKIKDGFKLEFYRQKNSKNISEDFGTEDIIPIRICNSGSRYQPFNLVFMRMYRNIQKANDSRHNHQIHIEEYLYNKNKIKELKK